MFVLNEDFLCSHADTLRLLEDVIDNYDNVRLSFIEYLGLRDA